MILVRSSLALAALVLAGCASDDPMAGQRTVFSNPVTGTVLDPTGIGPHCDARRGRDATCLGLPLTRKGRGTTIGDQSGTDLTRAQRRILRQRAELLRTQAEALVTPPPPMPSAPPTAQDVTETATP